MKAYITNSNSKSIIYHLDTRGINVSEQIFRISFKWFNRTEIRNLLAFKMLYENPVAFFKHYKKKESLDTKQFIFEGQSPAYHSSADCEKVRSSFNNYRLPDEIVKRGDDEIIEFRNWVLKNRHLLEDKQDLFLERARWKFNLETRPEAIYYGNSGVEIVEDLNLEDLERVIENKINEANEFYASSKKHRIILDTFGHYAYIHKKEEQPRSNNTNYSNEEIWTVLKEFDEEYKTPIMFHLREYYRVKFNADLVFEGTLLAQLGFRSCSTCNSRVIRETFGFDATALIPPKVTSQAEESTIESEYCSYINDIMDVMEKAQKTELEGEVGLSMNDVNQPIMSYEQFKVKYFNAEESTE